MPLDPITGSIIGDLGGAAINAMSVAATNAQNERLQREEWSREDNAVRRRVADLEAAGLNKVLAASGAGAPTSLTTQFKSPIDIEPGIYSRGIAAKTAATNMARTEADTKRVQSEADVAYYNSLSAEAKARIDRATADLMLQRGSDALPEKLQGMNFLEAKTLLELQGKDITNILTGTNQESRQLILELLNDDYSFHLLKMGQYFL